MSNLSPKRQQVAQALEGTVSEIIVSRSVRPASWSSSRRSGSKSYSAGDKKSKRDEPNRSYNPRDPPDPEQRGCFARDPLRPANYRAHRDTEQCEAKNTVTKEQNRSPLAM